MESVREIIFESLIKEGLASAVKLAQSLIDTVSQEMYISI